MLVIGIIGVLLCLGGVIVLGLDFSRFFGLPGQEGGYLHFTRISDLMRDTMPDTWMRTANYIDDATGANGVMADIAGFMVEVPATLVFVALGMVLVIVGFRVRRYQR